MNRIVWIASYPKSGNTWMRVFLSNYTADCESPTDINSLSVRSIASGRQMFDEQLAVGASNLRDDEIDEYRPEVYKSVARQATDIVYIKAHDACTTTASGVALFPPEVSLAAIYLVRNPLDVAVSLANHLNRSLEATIAFMESDSAALASSGTRLHSQLRQRLFSWSQHVESWLDAAQMPVHVMRYEDMLAAPEETFLRSLRFLGIQPDGDRVRRALEWSSFSALRRQELKHGFIERPSGVAAFFRSGRSGEGRETLSPQQIDRVSVAHAPMMRRLGYLPR